MIPIWQYGYLIPRPTNIGLEENAKNIDDCNMCLRYGLEMVSYILNDGIMGSDKYK